MPRGHTLAASLEFVGRGLPEQRRHACVVVGRPPPACRLCIEAAAAARAVGAVAVDRGALGGEQPGVEDVICKRPSDQPIV